MSKLKFPTPDNTYYFEHYISFIISITEKRENKRIGYMEGHHIIPRSFFEEVDTDRDDPENLIYLTAREHYIAHKLLARAYEHHHSEVSAFWYMSTKGRHIITAEEYSEAREKFSRNHSEYMSGENNPFYGKNHTRESIERMKSSLPDYRGENNPFYGRRHKEDSLERMRQSHRGAKLSEEHKQKISQSLIGNKRRLGYVYTDEEKEMLKKRIFHKPCKFCGEVFETKSNFVTICQKCKERGINGR